MMYSFHSLSVFLFKTCFDGITLTENSWFKTMNHVAKKRKKDTRSHIITTDSTQRVNMMDIVKERIVMNTRNKEKIKFNLRNRHRS